MAKKVKAGGVVKKPTNAERDSLAKELRSLIPKLDSEGLAFLVKQGRVHLYNMQVDKLNKAAVSVNVAAARSHSIAAKSRAQGKAKVAAGEKMRIQGSESGSSYFLFFRNANIMFSRGEMISLVKIASGKGTDMEIRERLYNWFERERRDIFAFVPIAGKFDEQLKTLAAVIKKSLKLREKA
jgi:hypothetical protein